MMADKSLKKCSHATSEVLHEGKWFRFCNYQYNNTVDNKTRTYEVIERTTACVQGSDGTDIIAILKRELHYDCIVLVKQYRPAAKGYTLEFPAGLLEEGETIEACALRELKEETGYTGYVESVSPVVCIDASISSTTTVHVSVQIDGDDIVNANPKQHLDPDEFVEVILVPLDNLNKKLRDFQEKGVKIDGRLLTFALGRTHAL